jgi:Actin-like ATPase involved in cell division
MRESQAIISGGKTAEEWLQFITTAIVTDEDIRRVIDAAQVLIPNDREILHILPQEFIVYDQDGVQNPLGMAAARLEVNVHIVTGSVTSAQNIIKCCNQSGA